MLTLWIHSFWHPNPNFRFHLTLKPAPTAPKTPDYAEVDSFWGLVLEVVSGKGTTLAFRLVIVSAIGFLMYFGKDMVNDTIRNNPDVAASREAVAKVSSIADEANAKADRLLDTQSKIFSALQDQSRATQAVSLSIATLGSKLDSVSTQLDRVEGRQYTQNSHQ
jgi:cell division protein FtsB